MNTSADMINVSHVVNSTTVLGPGNRFVLWVQGCNKRCKNCINPAGQTMEEGQLISVENIFQMIYQQEGIQGVTISGGEPLLQFPAVFKLVMLIKEYTNLDIMLFSGYTYEEIKMQYSKEILDLFFGKIDIFVDGEYIDELNDNQMYRGSGNQNIYFFTDKYRSFEDKILNTCNRDIEFEVENNTDVFLVGIPPRNFQEEFIASIKQEVYNNEKQDSG